MAATSRGGAIAVTAEMTREKTPAESLLGKLLTAGGVASSASAASVARQLFEKPYLFHFNQAVTLLERLYPDRRPVGRGENPYREVVRFRSHLSLSFPPSSIVDIQPPAGPSSPAQMTVAFFGLYGPSGVLPRFYTEKLIELERSKQKEKNAFREWLDLFNHHLIALFFRAWEKYRLYVAYARGEYQQTDVDLFTLALLSFIGLGGGGLRYRLQVKVRDQDDLEAPQVLAQLPDVALLPCAGLLAQRPRNALNLGRILVHYFRFPVQVIQFHGQWLYLDEASQTRLGRGEEDKNQFGDGIVVGSRVWSIQSKLRLRVGPLTYAQFLDLLPDRRPTPQRKTFFLLSHLVRLYIGPDLNFDVQLVLHADEVPATQLSDDGSLGPRLGWNVWLSSGRVKEDADQAVFDGEPLTWAEPEEP